MIDKETSLGLEVRQKPNIAKNKEMHKERKKQRHAEEQGPAKNGGLEVMQKIKMSGCRKWACFHPRRKTFQLGVEAGPNQEMLFTALRDVRPGAAQLC